MAVVEAAGIAQLRHEYAAELLILKASALRSLADPSWSVVATEAMARAYSSGFRALESEVEFFAALTAWTDHRTSEAVEYTDRILDAATLTPSYFGPQRDDYLFTQDYWRARTYELRGFLEGGREHYDAQAQSLICAFKAFDRCGVDDVAVEARLLSNLSVLVRDLDLVAVGAYVEDRAARLRWNGTTFDDEFAVYTAIAWSHARRGDHIGAFRALRRAADCTASVPSRILAMVDRSFLARELGEVFTAQEDLDAALRLAKQVDWEHALADQRTALYALARVVAPTDPKAAATLWNRYTSCKAPVPMYEMTSAGDRRLRGEECTAHAAVLRHSGQTGRAVTLLLESLTIWSEIGYAWREAEVALELFELTGESRYLEIADAQAAKQPHSWLGRRLTKLHAGAPQSRP